MTFRTRLAIAVAAAAILPLALLGGGVRREMTARLDAQATRRIEGLIQVLQSGLAAETASLRARLATQAEALAGDNRFRLAAGSSADRRWLLDWAGEAMAASGLAVLRVMDSDGRVLSSGHFRNEFDRTDPALLTLLRPVRDPALIRLPGPERDVTALAAADSFLVGGRRYYLVGGVPFDTARVGSLVPQDEIAVSLVTAAPSLPNTVARIDLPYYDATTGAAADTAHLVVTRDPAPMRLLRARVDRWLAIAAGVTLVLAAILAITLSRRVSRPLAELAEKTSRLDLDRLDQDFASDREDEIGALSNLLAEMTDRLRASTARLREAERRAATGDLARQINHDVKNGLAPIRHVLRHLAETAVRSPNDLVDVFRERQGTLESSVNYLDGLARNYARLAPAVDRGATSIPTLLQEIARGMQRDGVDFEVRVPDGMPPARADGVVVRRILENLTSNAVDALEGRPGRVTLGSELRPGPEPRIRVTVADTGKGMTAAELERAFDDFHTTKAGGTGLGLSVVRRLVGDLGGSLRVETSPGQGSTFIVELPTA